MANSTVITTLNCEGVVRSTDYIKSFMDETSCDILQVFKKCGYMKMIL